MKTLTRLIRNRLGLPFIKSFPVFSFSSQTLPQLIRKPDELLVSQWWSQTRTNKTINKNPCFFLYDFLYE